MKKSASGVWKWSLFAAALFAVAACGQDPAGSRNLPPVIEALSADAEQVRAEGEVTLTVRAYDPDGAGKAASGDVSMAGGDAGAAAGNAALPGDLEVSWSVADEAWSITGNGATATVTAPSSYPAETEVTVTVTDADGASSSESMTIGTGQNELPRIGSVAAMPNPVEPTGTITLEAQATDGNEDELTYNWTAPEGWTLSSQTGANVELTAPDEDGASAQVELEVADGFGGTATRSVLVRTSDNAAPSISSMTASPPQVEPGGQMTVSVDATDPDGDELSYDWSAPMGWSVNGGGAEVTVTAPDSHGVNAKISVTVTDTRDHETTGRVVVSTPVNNGPVVNSLTASPQQVARGKTIDLAVSASDPDGDMLSYSWSVGATDWTMMGNGETATLQAPDTPGESATVSVTVSDADGKTGKASIVVSTRPNQPPAIGSVTASPSTTAPGGTIDLTATANDPDGGTLTYSWQAPKDWTLNGSGNEVTVTAPDAYGKTATIGLTVSDSFGGQATGSVSVATERNQSPIISALNANPSVVDKGGTSTLTVTASDANGDTLNYNWNAPSGWSINGSGKQVTLQAPSAYGKTATVDVTVDDGAGGQTVGSVTVSTDRNQAPTISGVTANPPTVPRQGTSTLTVTAADPNGDTLGYSWTVPAGWSKSGSGAQIDVTAPNKYDALGLFEVTVDDGNGATTKSSVLVQTKSNDAPVIVSSSITKTTLKPGEKTTAGVNATDLNGDSLTYNWKLPKGWKGSSTSDTITATAPRAYGKTFELVLEISDGSDTTTKKFSVQMVANKPPKVNSLKVYPNPVDAGKKAKATVTASDPLGDPLSYKWTIDNKDWKITGSGKEVTLTAPAKDSTAKLTVTVDDGFGEKVKATKNVESIQSLYNFSSHTFSRCGQSGRSGPTLSQCRSSYSTSWDGNNSYFAMDTQGIQKWTVPEDATYRIRAAGAQGGNGGGRGAIMQADIPLKRGDTLLILVGQRGGDSGTWGHGGGGTFVALGTDHTSATPLVVAGGGGGDRDLQIDASTGTRGIDGESGGGAGGQNGQGGDDGGSYAGAGGGGFYGNGGEYQGGQGGHAFRNGGVGGNGPGCWGGFGGGGACDDQDETGGGGGYSGGGGASTGGSESGGGGGSFIADSATQAWTSDGSFSDSSNADTGYSGSVGDLNSWSTGHGSVTITKQ